MTSLWLKVTFLLWCDSDLIPMAPRSLVLGPPGLVFAALPVLRLCGCSSACLPAQAIKLLCGGLCQKHIVTSRNVCLHTAL